MTPTFRPTKCKVFPDIHGTPVETVILTGNKKLWPDNVESPCGIIVPDTKEYRAAIASVGRGKKASKGAKRGTK